MEPRRYQLRAYSTKPSTLAIQSPVLPDDFRIQDLSSELVSETLTYFIVSGERLTQMTRTYDDIDAVVRLLQEKEVDLELAARIGHSLLEQNKELRSFINDLQNELSDHQEIVQQLKRELLSKEDLLNVLIDEQEEQESHQRDKFVNLKRRLADTERRVTEIVYENDILKNTLKTLSLTVAQTKSCENINSRSNRRSIESTPTRIKPSTLVRPYTVDIKPKSSEKFIDNAGLASILCTTKTTSGKAVIASAAAAMRAYTLAQVARPSGTVDDIRRKLCLPPSSAKRPSRVTKLGTVDIERFRVEADSFKTE